ncbi:NHL repeat domain-containing protein [Ditylenchus destructor]|nr:NHL repeat domain-containing protein [Ditylenchus destructor]
MILLFSLLLQFILIQCSSVRRITNQLKQQHLQIQGYSPTQDDDYVAISMKAEPGYIVKFEPFASADRVHHMLLYGCSQPAYDKDFWRGGATCGSSTHILYAWARNAPPLTLPEGVAFPIGNEDDPVQYLVLQIHYARPFDGKVRDFSGVTLHLSESRPRYVAAVYLFVTGQPIPPHQPAFLNNMSCSYNSDTELHPFAFRTHTHAMGRVVSAYVKKTQDGKWSQIGKRNPQWPQLFQPSESGLVIKKGDFMAATCRFESIDKDKPVPMGSMGVDEMCNFYMMFYRDVNSPDPFPYGAGCAMNENPDLVNKEYPVDVEKARITEIGGERLGQVSGLAFDNAGNVVIFHRGRRTWGYATFTADNVLQDKTPIDTSTVLVGIRDHDGTLKLQAKYGKSLFYMPHSIFVDDSNYYYTTDVGSHQVIKWEIRKGELQPVWELGEKFVPGSDRTHFCKPSGVAVSRSDGSVYVADGYCNNRIMKFTKDGRYVTEWGKGSTYGREGAVNMGLGYFSLPHDVSLDEKTGHIYVADRENGRVQAFTSQGDPVFEIKNPRLFQNVYSVHYCDEHGLFFIPGSTVAQTSDTENHEINVYSVPIGSNNKIQYSFRPKSDAFHRPHILRAKGNSVFVGEIDEAGGVLWHLEIQAEQNVPMDHGSPVAGATAAFGSGVAHLTNFANDLMSDANTKIAKENPWTGLLVVALMISGAYLLCYCVYTKCCCCCGRKKSPQDNIDRKGFQPLKTVEADESSDDDSDDEFKDTKKLNPASDP